MIDFNSIKAVLMLAGIASIGLNIYQKSVSDDQLENIGSLNSQLESALLSQNNLSAQIEKFDSELIENQKVTDELTTALKKSEQREDKVITQIQEIIKYEDCTNHPIPDGIEWVYDDKDRRSY